MNDSLNLENIKKELEEKLEKVSSEQDLLNIQIEYFGKKGILRQLFSKVLEVPIEQRKELGEKINSLKKEAETITSERRAKITGANPTGNMDLYNSLPGKKPEIGHTHIISQAISEIIDIFKPLGFTRVRYPEIDWEYYAFEALNMPSTHPARDEWETFFVDSPVDKKYGRMVITPHTSTGQVREMLRGNLPIRMLNISRCGRRQIDISHVPSFYQFEGLVVDRGISTTHLKGVLNYFASNFFGEDRKTRLRPYHFRFTEPSFEVDIDCGICHGKGCKLCKDGWLELGGAGMVHPNVLKAGGIDSEVYTGFAFGWGVERTYMMKSGTKIDDIRYLFGNDLRFLEQF
ncbi:MAG: phenylalanine--tRNA ligase subunit alpha [Patescibacteria group bacterium]